MGKIIILPETTLKPITLIGARAGVCYGSDVSNEEKNYKRGLQCIEDMHGRTLEFPDIHMVLDGYSARVIREYYTHIGCLPTRLQASTRYINYKNFEYIVPKSIENNSDTKLIYDTCMKMIKNSLKMLDDLQIPKEDIANILPLGMTTKIVDKRNLRNLIDMSYQRKCTRTYWEFRELFIDIENALREYSDEWEWIVNNLFMSKCEFLGYCPEKNSCGWYSNK